MLILNDK